MILALGLLVFLLVFGPTAAMLTSFFGGMKRLILENFFQMSMYRGEAGMFGEPAGWAGDSCSSGAGSWAMVR